MRKITIAAATSLAFAACSAHADQAQLQLSLCMMGADPSDQLALNRCIAQFGPPPRNQNDATMRTLNNAPLEWERQNNQVVTCYNTTDIRREVRQFMQRCPVGWSQVR